MITQGYLEPVRLFASRIDQEFKVQHGGRQQSDAFFLYRRITKIKWLLQGVRPQVLDYLEPKYFLDRGDMRWIEFVEAVQDAEWLYFCDHPMRPVQMWYDPVPRNNLGKFTVDSEGYAVVFTAGAFVAGRRSFRHATGGIGVWFKEDHLQNVSDKETWAEWMDDFALEVSAAIMALSIAKSYGLSRLAIVTDSRFMIDTFIQNHIRQFLANGWKRPNGQPVLNRRQYRLLLEHMETIAVKWVHVEDDSSDWEYHYGMRRAKSLAMAVVKKN